MTTTLTFLPEADWPKNTFDEVVEHYTLPSLTFQFTKWNRKICVQATRTGERKWKCTFARWFKRLPEFKTVGNVSRLDPQTLGYAYAYRTIIFTDHCHLDDNFAGDDVRILQFTLPPGPRAIYWLSATRSCDGTLLPPEPGAVSPYGGRVRLKPHNISIEIQAHAHKMRDKYVADCTSRNSGMIYSHSKWMTPEEFAKQRLYDETQSLAARRRADCR
jgi:hypothetical protein